MLGRHPAEFVVRIAISTKLVLRASFLVSSQALGGAHMVDD